MRICKIQIFDNLNICITLMINTTCIRQAYFTTHDDDIHSMITINISHDDDDNNNNDDNNDSSNNDDDDVN